MIKKLLVFLVSISLVITSACNLLDSGIKKGVDFANQNCTTTGLIDQCNTPPVFGK